MKHTKKWEQMTQEEQIVFLCKNIMPGHRELIRKAGKRLAQLILDDAELSEVKIADLEKVLEEAKECLKDIYGQASLRQASEAFGAMPEEGSGCPWSELLGAKAFTA